eukprot:CAMPEP_0175307584 /NCGR_PEP_ID=MMETSP0093-20121207/64847_1 /TAXON_ID=311494 /ORGANISM="Alexandrium monilatum, Strain CCMP3105" /LENGTH=44 /DNA_ID= /DNA_START= /DNA_END= /DNA_ORIENTATION=
MATTSSRLPARKATGCLTFASWSCGVACQLMSMTRYQFSPPFQP